MNEKKLFAMLDELEFTREMADKFFSCSLSKEERKNLPKECILTPCPIAYVNGDNLEIFPYLDIRRKAEIWGIQTGNIVFKKTEENPRTFIEAVRLESLRPLVCGKKQIIPWDNHFDEAYIRRNLFNKTVEILNEYNIEADEWGCAYWALGPEGENDALTYMMNWGCGNFHGMADMKQNVRLMISLD